MPLLLVVATILIVGFGLGVGSAYWAVAEGARFNTVHVGPWTTYPNASSVDSDPYSRAHQIFRKALPVAAADSLTLEAWTDSEGRPLDGSCVYRVSGALPAARFWTIATMPPEDAPPPEVPRRALTSVEVMRMGDTAIDVTLSPRARPGNWLPSADGRYVLVVNLYDTPIGSGVGPETLVMPDIAREACP